MATTDHLEPSASVAAGSTVHNMSHEELAGILGCSRRSARDRRSGRCRWTVADVVALADHLDVTVDALARELVAS